jgi:hypothetical protein
MCPSKNFFPDEKSIYLRNPLSKKKRKEWLKIEKYIKLRMTIRGRKREKIFQKSKVIKEKNASKAFYKI